MRMAEETQADGVSPTCGERALIEAPAQMAGETRRYGFSARVDSLRLIAERLHNERYFTKQVGGQQAALP